MSECENCGSDVDVICFESGCFCAECVGQDQADMQAAFNREIDLLVEHESWLAAYDQAVAATEAAYAREAF